MKIFIKNVLLTLSTDVDSQFRNGDFFRFVLRNKRDDDFVSEQIFRQKVLLRHERNVTLNMLKIYFHQVTKYCFLLN